MRSLALIALGTFAAVGLVAQSLSEHAAAAAGATVGTAAGKPLGTALGKIFGGMNKETNGAAGVQKAKPVKAKVDPKAIVKPEPAPASAPNRSVGLATFGPGNAGGNEAPPVHRVARRRHGARVAAAVLPTVAETPVAPLAVEIAVQRPTEQEFAAVKVGETGGQLADALGIPESKVSIPEDDGHMVEICDYWSNGQPLGRVRLDNGKVVNVTPSRGY